MDVENKTDCFVMLRQWRRPHDHLPWHPHLGQMAFSKALESVLLGWAMLFQSVLDDTLLPVHRLVYLKCR